MTIGNEQETHTIISYKFSIKTNRMTPNTNTESFDTINYCVLYKTCPLGTAG